MQMIGTKALLIVAGVGLGWMTAPASGQGTTGMVPAHPKVLFGVLPKQVENWKIIESTGRSGYSDWLESEVTRKYEEVLPPNNPQGKVAGVTEVSLVDTAKFPDSDLLKFSNFEEVNIPGLQHRFVGGNPAIIMSGNGGATSFFLLKNRFILTIKIQNQPQEAIGSWFKLVDHGKLNGIPDGRITKSPGAVSSIWIDEMNPKNNQSYVAAIGDGNIDMSDFSEEDLELDVSADEAANQKVAAEGQPQ